MAAMTTGTLQRAGLGSVAGRARPGCGGGRRICSDSSKNPAVMTAGLLSSPGCCRTGPATGRRSSRTWDVSTPPAHGAGQGWLPSSLRMNPYSMLTGGSRGGRGPPLFSRGSASIRASRSSAFNRRGLRRSSRSTDSPSRVLDAPCAISRPSCPRSARASP